MQAYINKTIKTPTLSHSATFKMLKNIKINGIHDCGGNIAVNNLVYTYGDKFKLIDVPCDKCGMLFTFYYDINQ